MRDEPMTVVIPVGPNPHHRTWLDEAIRSVEPQLQKRDRIMIVRDGPGAYFDIYPYKQTVIFKLPWRMGVAGAFNAGVGWAANKLIVMLGADDRLLPGAIDACVQTWEENDRADAYYWMSVEYGDDRKDKIQALPCNAAMVTRAFWRWSGGFPPETASGAPDAALVSMLMVHAPERLIAVQQGTPLTWVRVHEHQDTAKRQPWQSIILATRELLTERGFQP